MRRRLAQLVVKVGRDPWGCFKAKSVVFTDAGRERAEALLDALVGTQAAATRHGEAATEGRKKKVRAVLGPNKKPE